MTHKAETTRRPMMTWLAFAAAIGFLGGLLVMAAVVTIFPSGVAAPVGERVGASPVAAPPVAASPKIEVKPTKLEEPSPVSPPPAAELTSSPIVTAYPGDDLRARNLTLPVQGVKPSELHDMFNDTRGSSRRHEALDILAPRNTPVLAVEDGKIAKLFLSVAGGITIYHFDPSSSYAYYYAHLERYADGLREGDTVKRGQVLGYVGTSGNAPRDTPHLHFAIFKLGEDRKWWQGTPVDPYSLLK